MSEGYLALGCGCVRDGGRWDVCRNHGPMFRELVAAVAVVDAVRPMLCTYNPEELREQAIGMFHCPECGEMQLAGVPHIRNAGAVAFALERYDAITEGGDDGR